MDDSRNPHVAPTLRAGIAWLLAVPLLAGGLAAQAADAPGAVALQVNGKYLENAAPAPLKVNDRLDFFAPPDTPSFCAAGKGSAVLYLDGLPVKGLTPMSETAGARASFTLRRTDESRDLWVALHNVSHTGKPLPVELGVGCADGGLMWQAAPACRVPQPDAEPCAVPANGSRVPLLLLPSGQFGLWVLAMVLFGAVTAGAMSRGMLRDPPFVPPVVAPPANTPPTPFSFSKSQLLAWFVAVVVAASYIGIVTGQLPGLGPQVLGFLGVSAGTSILARAIEAQRTVQPTASVDWLTDILSDQTNQFSVARFQAAIVTAGLIAYFLWQAYVKLLLPELDATWAALMALSSATYLSFKLPDVKTPPATPAEAKKDEGGEQ